MSVFKLDFIGIGAAKSATTWLAQCLAEHPDICMSHPKELNFFGRRHVWPPGGTHYDNGLPWLSAHFRDCHPRQVKGEFSVSYLVDPESPALIKKVMPDVRLIVSLRNPIDSLYSFYFHLKKAYVVPETFEGLLQQYPDFIDYGDYLKHLQRFFAEFPSDRIHILLFDDLEQAPHSALRRLFEFLEVDCEFQPPSLRRRINARAEPRIPWVRDMIGGTRDYLRVTPGMKSVQRILRALGGEIVANWVQEINLRPIELPPMRGKTRKQLQRRYAPGNRELGAFLHRSLRHWR